MGKVGEGSIPMPYVMWKEMHDRIEDSRETYKKISDILEIHKNLIELSGFADGEAQDIRRDHVAMALQAEQCRKALEEMEESFKKYYSFEP